MSDTEITERQQYWLDHIRAAEAREENIAAYARTEGLTPKELYQWKTILTRRGLLAGKKGISGFRAGDGAASSRPVGQRESGAAERCAPRVSRRTRR